MIKTGNNRFDEVLYRFKWLWTRLLNLLTFVLSIPILITGIWLSKQANTECEQWLEKRVTVLGVFLMLVSFAGVVGACCGVSWLLWVYLLVMFILIVNVMVFTIFAFAVTNKGAGEVISSRGYKEYRLGDYSNWFQKRVNDTKNWAEIKSCLQDGELCSTFSNKYLKDTAAQFYSKNLSVLQSGCCKPSNDCNFTYVAPTNWTKTVGVDYVNPDCNAWENDPTVLCFNCQSCKAGLLDNLRSDWKKVAIVNIIFLVVLIVVYSVGCCALRNNRKRNAYFQEQ